MTDHIRSEIAAWVDFEYGNCPVSASELFAYIDAQAAEIGRLRAELAKPVELQKTDVLGITTAYEQGVGKGHQSKMRGKIACPYANGAYAEAWNLGYSEGKEQADRLHTTYVVVTKNQSGQIVAVTRQDADGRIVKVIAESVPTPAWHDAPETIALKAERDRYRQALEAMTKKEPCDCGCPSGESVVLLKPTHYYAIASEALKSDAAIAKAEGRTE